MTAGTNHLCAFFFSTFTKKCFLGPLVEWAILTKFIEQNCSTETAVREQCAKKGKNYPSRTLYAYLSNIKFKKIKKKLHMDQQYQMKQFEIFL